MIVLWTWGTAAGAAGAGSIAPAVPTRRRAATSAAVFAPNRNVGCMASPFLFRFQLIAENHRVCGRGTCRLHPLLHPPASERRNGQAMRDNSLKSFVSLEKACGIVPAPVFRKRRAGDTNWR